MDARENRPRLPVNMPAIGDLFDMFDFDHGQDSHDHDGDHDDHGHDDQSHDNDGDHHDGDRF